MYKKNLVKTAMLASIISISMSGCGGCGKEEVVSALDTAQEVVASVEEKTVEKAVEDNVIASVDKIAEKEIEAPVSETAASIKENEKEVVSDSSTNKVQMLTDEEFAQIQSSMPDSEFRKMTSDQMLEWIGEKFCDSEGELLISQEDYQPYEDMFIEKLYQETADEINALIAEQQRQAVSQEYTGPRPTGGSQNVIYDPTPVDTTITTNTRGNIS